jgi:hypothetical protein
MLAANEDWSPVRAAFIRPAEAPRNDREFGSHRAIAEIDFEFHPIPAQMPVGENYARVHTCLCDYVGRHFRGVPRNGRRRLALDQRSHHARSSQAKTTDHQSRSRRTGDQGGFDRMMTTSNGFNPQAEQHLMLAYVADLELEVDRLRKLSQFLQQAARHTVEQVQRTCSDFVQSDANEKPVADISAAINRFEVILKDGYEPTGYHPSHDQVVVIALRPLIEQIFRWQQRLLEAPDATLHLELSREHVDWFPARLRHILDNLISNALRYRDPMKGEARVSLSLVRSADGYQLRVSDNGVGMPWAKRAEAFELYHRAGPARAIGVGVGIAVVKLLLEQSGGSLTVESGDGQGTSFVAVLPYYAAEDYLN